MKKSILIGGLFLASFSSFSQSNNALSFDGVNDDVTIANQPLKDATNFTIEAQVKNETPNPDADVFLQFFDATDTRFEVRLNEGKLAIFSQVVGLEPSSTFTVPVGSFFHMALVKNGQVTKLYANYTEVLTLNGNYSLGSGLRIGRYFDQTGNSFKGQLDELRFWNVAKTLDEIKTEPTCALVGNEPNLVGYWDFNQGVAGATNTASTTLEDKSSGSANGTLNNFALTGASSNWVASRVVCTVAEKNALSFDGSDDAVSIPNQPLKDATDFTIEVQLLNENANPNEDVFMQFYDVNDTRFELRFDSGKLSFYAQKLSSTLTTSTFTVPVGSYFKVALVKSGTTSKLYAQGVEVLSFTGQYSLGSGLQLGRYFGDFTYSFKGKMDELRFWNVAKTISQINAAPVCGLVGNEANLVGYWDFNNGVSGGTNTGITTLADKSSSNANGTLNNFALSGTSSNWVASTACTDLVTGTENTELSNTVKIFPNPATNWIEIQGAENNSTVEIYSVSGQLVLSQELNGRISLPATLDAGMYIVNVKGSKTSKHVIVKQ